MFATKKVAWRVCFEELFWFIGGCTDNAVLRKWLHRPSLMVLILELDAIEGVIFRYLDSFAALELVFLSTAISTNVLPTLRPIYSDPSIVDIIVAAAFF